MRYLWWSWRGSVVLWVTFLIGFTAFSIYFGVGRSAPTTDSDALIVGGALFLGVVLVEWGWRSAAMTVAATVGRLLILVATIVWLRATMMVHVAARAASEAANPITLLNGITLSPFGSGVVTMEREMALLLREAWFPILILVWLCAWPSLVRLGRLGTSLSEDDDATAEPVERSRTGTREIDSA